MRRGWPGQLAHAVVGGDVQALQQFIGQSPWDAEAVLHAHQAYVGETLGDAEEGAFISDGCDVPKQGTESVGAAVVWTAGQARQLPVRRGGVRRQPARLHPGGPSALPARAMVHPGVRGSARPTRSIYHFKLMIALIEDIGFHLAHECFWYNPAKMPAPAEWVTVRRVRVRDSVGYVWWFSKTPWPKANNRNVLRAYSKDMIRLNSRGVRATTRPSTTLQIAHAVLSSSRGEA